MGRAKPKAGAPRQVKIAETVPEHEVIQTEAIEGPEHETMMISAEVAGDVLEQALDLSTSRATEVHVASSARGPGADKAVVGALDSACNRVMPGSGTTSTS